MSLGYTTQGGEGLVWLQWAVTVETLRYIINRSLKFVAFSNIIYYYQFIAADDAIPWYSETSPHHSHTQKCIQTSSKVLISLYNHFR